MLKLAIISFVVCMVSSRPYDEPLKVKGAGPCFNARRNILVNSGPAIGQFVPQCTDGGWYNIVQSHGSTGFGWCVNPKTGEEVAGTRARGVDAASCPKCFVKLASELRPAGSFAIGGCPPQCDANGNFTPRQGCGSTGYSWCVDPASGNTIGEKKPPGQNNIALACE